MNKTITHLAGFFVALVLVACGGAPAPVKPVEKAPDKPAVEAAPVAEATPKGPNPEEVALCLATANAKRAKFSGEPPKVTVKHVLVKYTGAKNADAAITRTREEACMRALEARNKLAGGAEFDDVVKEFSEEPGAASRNGSIGSVERKDLAKPFADAAFELSLNQMSDIVETEFGFHLILRTE
jgi:NIMA-interacting peptidyl-prolyl cis-trans isomerase 1